MRRAISMKPLVAAFFLSLISTLALSAQSAAWAPVRGLGLGQRVEVRRFSGGGIIRGTVERVTDNTLVIRQKRGVATVDRLDVRRVRIDSGKRSRFGQIIAPTAMGSVALHNPAPRWNRGADAAFAIGSGYLLGWGLDSMVDDYRRKTVYEAQSPPKK